MDTIITIKWKYTWNMSWKHKILMKNVSLDRFSFSQRKENHTHPIFAIVPIWWLIIVYSGVHGTCLTANLLCVFFVVHSRCHDWSDSHFFNFAFISHRSYNCLSAFNASAHMIYDIYDTRLPKKNKFWKEHNCTGYFPIVFPFARYCG